MTLDKHGTGSEVTVTGGTPAGQGPRPLLVHGSATCPEGHYLVEPGQAGLRPLCTLRVEPLGPVSRQQGAGLAPW